MSKFSEIVVSPAPRYMMRLALLEQLFHTFPENLGSFMEIGPGMGDVSAYVQSQFPHSQGTLVEFSEVGVNLLENRFEGQERIRIHSTDFQEIKFDSSFSLIMAFEVLEHIEKDVEALQSIARLLEPGGIFLFSVPAHMHKWQQCDEYAGHYRRYERDEITEKLSTVGLSVETLWSYGFPVTHLLYPARQAYYGLKRYQNPRQSKENATKKSGIERPLTRSFLTSAMLQLLKPCYLIQEWMKNTEVGDGYIVAARRVE